MTIRSSLSTSIKLRSDILPHKQSLNSCKLQRNYLDMECIYLLLRYIHFHVYSSIFVAIRLLFFVIFLCYLLFIGSFFFSSSISHSYIHFLVYVSIKLIYFLHESIDHFMCPFFTRMIIFVYFFSPCVH